MNISKTYDPCDFDTGDKKYQFTDFITKHINLPSAIKKLLRDFCEDVIPTYVIIDTDDLTNMYFDVIDQTRHIDPHITFYKSKITAFRHPVTKQIVSIMNGYTERYKFFKKLFLRRPPSLLIDRNLDEFINQS